MPPILNAKSGKAWTSSDESETMTIQEFRDYMASGKPVGDGCRIGANAVLSPETLLMPKTIVRRLELIEQDPL